MHRIPKKVHLCRCRKHRNPNWRQQVWHFCKKQNRVTTAHQIHLKSDQFYGSGVDLKHKSIVQSRSYLHERVDTNLLHFTSERDQ